MSLQDSNFWICSCEFLASVGVLGISSHVVDGWVDEEPGEDEARQDPTSGCPNHGYP